ncbi:MAG: hypothetical protein ACLQAT_10405 [Candidatus Binataceae bacterium]
MTRFSVLALGAMVAFIAAASWIGCGVKSKPVPPQAARPQPIEDLRAASVKDGIRLTWGRPTTYEAGGRMRNLGSFAIMRSDDRASFHEVGEVQVTDQERFQQQQVFTFTDMDTAVGQGYIYEIVSFTQDNYKSLPSNRAPIERTVPRPPPNPDTYMLPTPTPLPLP